MNHFRFPNETNLVAGKQHLEKVLTTINSLRKSSLFRKLKYYKFVSKINSIHSNFSIPGPNLNNPNTRFATLQCASQSESFRGLISNKFLSKLKLFMMSNSEDNPPKVVLRTKLDLLLSQERQLAPQSGPIQHQP